MKRHWMKVGIGFLWIASSISQVRAAVVELPLDPQESGKSPVAFSVDYSGVYDRHLDSSGSGGRNVKSGRITDANQVHAKILYAMNRYLNLYAKAGFSNWSEKLLFNDGGKTDINFDWSVSWGVGVTGGHQFSKGWQIFYDLQYLSTENADVSSIKEAVRSVSSKAGEADYRDFHIAGGLGREFHTYYEWASVIFPYVAVRYSTLTINHSSITWNTNVLGDDVEEDSNFGVIAGIRFGNDSNLTLRLEGRLLDETAFTVAVDYRF